MFRFRCSSFPVLVIGIALATAPRSVIAQDQDPAQRAQALRQIIVTMEDEARQLETKVAQARARLDDLNRQAEAAEQELAALDGKAAQARDELAALTAQRDTRRAENTAAGEKLAGLRGTAVTLDARIEALAERHEQAKRDLARIEKAGADREQVLAEIETARTRAATLRDEVAALVQQRDALQAGAAAAGQAATKQIGRAHV